MGRKWTHPFARNSVVKGCAVELGGGRYSGSRSGESDGDDFEHFGCKYVEGEFLSGIEKESGPGAHQTTIFKEYMWMRACSF